MKRLLFLLLVVTLLDSYAQDQIKVDSLTVKLENSSEDTVKLAALQDLYLLHFRIDNYVSLDYAEEIFELAHAVHNQRYEDLGLYYQILSYMYIGDYDKALEISDERLKLNEKNNNIGGIFGTYHDRGVVYDRLRQFDLALEYYFKALNIYNEDSPKDPKRFSTYKIQSLYNNIGNIYSSKGEPDIGEQYYQKAIEICIEKKDFMNLSVSYNNLGKYYTEKNEDDKALLYLRKALEIRDSIRDENGLGMSNLFLSYYFINNADYNKAISFARKGYQIGDKIPSQHIMYQSASLLAEAYDSLQQYDSAYYYYKVYKDLNDSLINKETLRKLEGLELQNNFELEVQKQQLALQKTRFRFVIFILLLVVLSGLLFFLIRYYKDRKERIRFENKSLKKEVEKRNKELTSNAMQQMRKNGTLASIEERLLSLKKKLDRDQKEQVQKIIFELRTLTNADVWDEFEIRFQKVHEDFYNNLKLKYPELSPSEIRLAAFLRLNMTTKDISSLTGLSVKSIETSRYRLRKKLGITNKEVNLVNFLLDI